MSTVACDISEFQPVVNDTYPHRWLTFRVCDGDYTDHNVRANLAWCKAARAAGKLDGFAAYVVYRPGMNGTILNQLDNAAIPTDCVVMVDVESWGGQIMGDRSTEINALCTALAKRQGSSSRVWGYANLNDYRTVWTTRPSWLGLVVASYGGQQPISPGPGPLVAWQYTDGQYTVPGLPSSSAPFGRCDHNLLNLDNKGGIHMDADVKARFDAIDAKLRSLADYAYPDGSHVQGNVQGIVRTELAAHASPAQVAAAVIAALPHAQSGGLTQADVEAALKAVLAQAAQ